MYLPKINRLWSDCVRNAGLNETAFTITNTTKLRSLDEPSYMVELERDGKRYHLYHFAGDRADELRELNEAYALVEPATAFGVSGAGSASLLGELTVFMDRHFETIQTSVDCMHGVEQAMRYIRDVRLAQWTPPF